MRRWVLHVLLRKLNEGKVIEDEEATTLTNENVEEIAAVLQSLAQYEIDGSFIISQAVASLRNANLSTHLLKIREECEENIAELASLIRLYGRGAPEHSRDFKGFFMQGYVGMRGLISDKGVMRALHTNIQMVANAYGRVLENSLPDAVGEKLKSLYKKVVEHLKCIESQA
jgi:uncharacterized protein (TIGR02284 family)